MDFKIEKKGYNRSEVDEYILKLVKGYEQTVARQEALIEGLKDKLEKSESKNKAYRDKESLISKAITGAVAKADEIDRLSRLKYTREMQQLKAFHDKWLSYYEKILKKYPLDAELSDVKRFNDEMSRILSKARAMSAAPVNKAKEQEKAPAAPAPAPAPADKEKSKAHIGYTVIDETEDDSGVFTGEDEFLNEDFDPVGRIRSFLKNKKEEPARDEEQGDEPQIEEEEAQSEEREPEPISAAEPKKDYGDRSESGFSFEEALHPEEDLEDIMRDLGLLLD